MADLSAAIAAAREAVAEVERIKAEYKEEPLVKAFVLTDLLDALDAAQPAAWVDADTALKIEPQYCVRGFIYGSNTTGDRAPLYLAPQAPPAAVPAANVTPMRQPRADLARLVESINAAVYANGDGLSVTEAIGALELAKLELLKEQGQ